MIKVCTKDRIGLLFLFVGIFKDMKGIKGHIFYDIAMK
jgi:hypothetical protein